MLIRAIKTQDSSQPIAKSTSPIKTSKHTAQTLIQNAFLGKLSRSNNSENKTVAPASNTIDGSFPSSQLENRLSFPSSSPVAGKRGIKQHTVIASAFNATSAFRENVTSAVETIGQPPVDGMSALRDAVYYDDADFEDDIDLDFDISEPVVCPSLTASTAAALPSPPSPSPPSWTPLPPPACSEINIENKQVDTYEDMVFPPRPKSDTSSNINVKVETYDDMVFPPRFPVASPLLQENEAPSSAPLPWSSSPAEHFQSLTVKRQYFEDVAANEEKPIKKKKARTVPWKEEMDVESSISMTNSRATGGVISRRSAGSMPWNDSFKNVEADRKESRKRNATKLQKRLVNTVASAREETKMAKKQLERYASIFLSEEQRSVVDLVLNNKQSVFFTGSAGTGKSVLLQELIATLKSKHRKNPDAVAVTASTGLAACNIGGVTLHSFAGVGLGKEPVADLVRKIKRHAKAKNRWIRTKILIIDEISMVDGELFDKLEAIARQIRNNGQRFGGIQLVITGDFFQLPPVPEGGRLSKFSFEADTWNECIAHTIGLTQVFRQRDPEFAAMLNEMRLGYLSPESIATFRQLSRPIDYHDGMQATELFSTRSEVDNANNAKMRQLEGDTVCYNAEDSGTIQDARFRDKLLSSCMAPPKIELKIHSQVMLIKNHDDSLVNGSLGRVIGFVNEKSYIAMLDADQDFRDEHLRKTAKVDQRTITTEKRWPWVEFSMPDGTTRQLLCQPEQWKVELPNGEVQACRLQVPLILAWALSIHKAQGQTLERVKVDLGRVFEKGQAYVALSRATCKEGLQVLRFDPSKVKAHDKVREFYNSLYSATEIAKRIQSTTQGTSGDGTESTGDPLWNQYVNDRP